MPFRDKNRVLKRYLFKTDSAPTKLLLGEDPKSVLVLRSLIKFGGLLAAGVVIATSIVLKDIPLICINLVLTCVVLFYQCYKIVTDKEERLRFCIELLLMLVAAGIAVWIAYPFLFGAPVTYLSVLIFANYIGTVINIASYVSNFFSPFIVGCLHNLLRRTPLKPIEDEHSKFELDEKASQVAINNILIKHHANDQPFDWKKIADKKPALVKVLNKSISWLDEKLKYIQSHFFSTEIYADKISKLKKLIRETRQGNIGDLLTEFQRKRFSRLAKIRAIQDRIREVEEIFSIEPLQEDKKALSTEKLENINTFLKQYTDLRRIHFDKNQPVSETAKKQIQARKQSIETALEEAKTYHRKKFDIFNGFLNDFANVGIEEKPLPELSTILEEKKSDSLSRANT